MPFVSHSISARAFVASSNALNTCTGEASGFAHASPNREMMVSWMNAFPPGHFSAVSGTSAVLEVSFGAETPTEEQRARDNLESLGFATASMRGSDGTARVAARKMA